MTRNQFKDRLRTFGWECFEKDRLENELLARYRDAQPRHKTKPIEDELTYVRTRIALTKEILGLMEPDHCCLHRKVFRTGNWSDARLFHIWCVHENQQGD